MKHYKCAKFLQRTSKTTQRWVHISFLRNVLVGVFNISFQGAKVWNDISDDIKLLSLSPALKRFKKKLESILNSHW